MFDFLTVIILLLFKPALDELWTVVQIIKSFFVSKVDLKENYGDWAVVTGCTDGIGKAYTFQLAKRGINVVLISRNPEKLKHVAEELESKFNIQTKIIVADFSKGEEVYSTIKQGLQGIEVGILVNNVGVSLLYPNFFVETSEKINWDMININMGSVTIMTRIVLPAMAKRKKGAIVNISSASMVQPLPLMGVYAASKVYVDHFTEALRQECREYGLTIQVLIPYFVSTKIVQYNEKLSTASFFVPDANTYAKHAIDTLGVIDNTTGYWPHRLQYLLAIVLPVWLRTFVGGLSTKMLRKNYLKSHPE